LACQACHPVETGAKAGENGATGARRYRGISSACSGCHADPHLGQFSAGGSEPGATDCAGCHTEDAFRPPSRFDHARTRFALTGAHAAVKCPDCHRSVRVLPGECGTRFRAAVTALRVGALARIESLYPGRP
jgi:hypothetical protein